MHPRSLESEDKIAKVKVNLARCTNLRCTSGSESFEKYQNTYVLALIPILGLRTKILDTYIIATIAQICFEQMKKNRKGNQPKKKEEKKKNLVRTGTVATSSCEIGPRERLGMLYLVSCSGLRSVIDTEDDPYMIKMVRRLPVRSPRKA